MNVDYFSIIIIIFIIFISYRIYYNADLFQLRLYYYCITTAIITSILINILYVCPVSLCVTEEQNEWWNMN